MIRRLALVLAALAFAGTAAAQPITASPPVGPVVGFVGPAMHSFVGIPYAEPPVGPLRWAPPVPHAAWTTPRDASTYGPRCAQKGSAFGVASTDEDCLSLNVYVPHRKAVPERDLKRKRPVMVWIHGGAFQNGSAENYDPTKLLQADEVIVVTINYRLGVLGFLAHPALSAESPDGVSGNYGILDQQLALRWVRDNIAAFGGDPRRVTIFGESAGGASVHAHLTSPAAAGLFHRAIVQSGAVFQQPTLEEGETLGTSAADGLGCPDQTAACLRALPAADVLAGQTSGLQTTSPVIDGVLLPLPFRTAFSTGAFNRVPVIEGSNFDEMTLFVAGLFDLQGTPVTEANYVSAVSTLLGVGPGAAALLASRYPTDDFPSPALALSALATDGAFACNAGAAHRWLARYVPVYAYEFDDRNAPMLYLPPVSFPYGAAHASEIQYLFDTPSGFPQALSPDQQLLSQTMARYWTRFARTGKPSARRAIKWPRYDANEFGEARIVALRAPAPGIKSAQTFKTGHKCAFWDPLIGN